MKFNQLGDGCYGVGDEVVSIRLQDLPVVVAGTDPAHRAGEPAWFDNDTLIYRTYSSDPADPGLEILVKYNVRTKQTTRLANRGANRVVAGGGKWAAWLDHFGVFGDFRTETGIVKAASFDGTFLITNDYQNDRGHALYAPDGRVTALPEEDVFDPFVVSPTSAIWVPTGGGEFRTLNLRVPKQVGPALKPSVATVNGEDWIVYWSNGVGLVAHPFDVLEGYLLVTTGDAYNHMAVAVNGKLRVGWATNQGESPDAQVALNVDLSKPRIDFTKTTSSGSVYIPPTLPEFRSFTENSTGSAAPTSNSSALIQPQLGLLEDDIVYRLSLLAVNVLQPLKNQYPNIVVKSGFRQVNSGISQHETGEAVDIQITNQTPELLYEVANWIQHTLPFDQLVLNFTTIGDGQPWIHVSFSPKSLRQQVLTKDFADTFHEGLFFVEPLTGEEAAAASRAQDDLDTQIFAELQKESARNAKMIPVSTVMDEVGSVLSGAAAVDASGLPTPGGSGSGTGGGNPGGRAAIVACVQKALGLQGTPYDSQENANIAFEVAKRVAWLLRDEGCGLLVGPSGGENIVQWQGYYFRAGRVCFPDGQIYKILTGVENGPQQGGHVPQWSDDGMVDASLYVAAIDPGADINLNWLQCAMTPSGTSDSGTAPGNGGGGSDGSSGRSGGGGGRSS